MATGNYPHMATSCRVAGTIDGDVFRRQLDLGPKGNADLCADGTRGSAVVIGPFPSPNRHIPVTSGRPTSYRHSPTRSQICVADRQDPEYKKQSASARPANYSLDVMRGTLRAGWRHLPPRCLISSPRSMRAKSRSLPSSGPSCRTKVRL